MTKSLIRSTKTITETINYEGTVADFIQELMGAMGVEEVKSFELRKNGGIVITVNSEDNPVLQEPAKDFTGITPVQSAEGGNVL